MRMRSVVALVRGNQRTLSRQVYCHGMRYRLYLLSRVVHDLDEREGHRVSHLISAALALTLTGLGATGTGLPLSPRDAQSASAVTGILDTLHARQATCQTPDRRRPTPSPSGGSRPGTVLATVAPRAPILAGDLS